jgi:hypothetical protein
MEVADAHGVRVAQRPERDFRGSPRPDAGHRTKSPVRVVPRHHDDLLEPLGALGDATDEVRPAALDAEGMELVIRDRRDHRGRGRQSKAEWSGRRFAPSPKDPAEATPRLGPGHLLLEDGRDQGFKNSAGPPEPNAGVATIELGDQAMASWHEARPVVIDSDERLEIGKHPVGARSPGLGSEVIAPYDEFDGRRPICRPRGSDNVTRRQSHRGVAAAAEVNGQRSTEVERGVERAIAAGHRGQSRTASRTPRDEVKRLVEGALAWFCDVGARRPYWSPQVNMTIRC